MHPLSLPPKRGSPSGCERPTRTTSTRASGWRIGRSRMARPSFEVNCGLYTVPLYGSISYSMYAAATGDVPSFQNAVLPGGGYAIQFPNVFPQALRGIPGAGTQDFRRANQIDLRDPQVQQWTATVERDLGWSTGLRVSYVGSSTKSTSEDLVQPRPESDPSEHRGVRGASRPASVPRLERGHDARQRIARAVRWSESRAAEALQPGPELQLVLHAREAQLGFGRRCAHLVHGREWSVHPRYVPRQRRLRPGGVHAASSLDQHLPLHAAVHQPEPRHGRAGRRMGRHRHPVAAVRIVRDGAVFEPRSVRHRGRRPRIHSRPATRPGGRRQRLQPDARRLLEWRRVRTAGQQHRPSSAVGRLARSSAPARRCSR